MAHVISFSSLSSPLSIILGASAIMNSSSRDPSVYTRCQIYKPVVKLMQNILLTQELSTVTTLYWKVSTTEASYELNIAHMLGIPIQPYSVRIRRRKDANLSPTISVHTRKLNASQDMQRNNAILLPVMHCIPHYTTYTHRCSIVNLNIFKYLYDKQCPTPKTKDNTTST